MFSVLLVDDEPIILSGLKRLINWEELGLEVIDCASGAQQALDMMSEREFDIVLTDVRMPDMSGIDMLHEMRERGIRSKVAVVSGFDDFKYIKSALRYGIENYIVKPVDETELKDTLGIMIDKIESERERDQSARQSDMTLQDNTICAWAGGTLDSSTLTDRLDFLGIDHTFASYVAVLVRCMDDSSGDQREYRRECLQSSFNHADDSLTIYSALTLDADLLLIACSNAEFQISALRPIVQRVMDTWALDTGARWFCAVGKPVDKPLELSKSYSQACALSTYCRMFSATNIIYLPEHEHTLNHVCEKLGLDISRVSNIMGVNAFDFDDWVNELDGLMPKLDPMPHKTMDWILSDLIFMALGGNISHEALDLFSKTPALSNPRKKLELLKSILRAEYDRLSVSRCMHHPLVRELMDTIEREYMHDISLKTLAARMGVTQTYLGRLFKKETGSLFTDYLTDYRLEKARSLLENTLKKTGDISREVGFSNPNYFANVFKKKVGVYPTKYRAQLPRES